MTKSKDLRDSTDPINKQLYFNPDLTPEQRKKDQELRNEMWKIRETQNKNVVIKKGQIVEVPHNVNKKRPTRQSYTTANTVSNDKQTENPSASSNVTATSS